MTTFDDLLEKLKAAGEPTRLRLLALLRENDLSVGELVQVLGQSQLCLLPRRTIRRGPRFPQPAVFADPP
jgi:DNA-binding transcriptional ArsR family regulator